MKNTEKTEFTTKCIAISKIAFDYVKHVQNELYKKGIQRPVSSIASELILKAKDV